MNHTNTTARGSLGQPRALLNGKLNILALAAALAFTAAPTAALAQEAAVQINIPHQSLSEALLKLAEQTPLQVFFAAETVAGITAPAVRGQMAPEEALKALLQGSGVTYQRNGNGITLSRTPTEAAQLESIKVVGSSSATTEGTGSYTSGVVTIGKGEKSLREIPQSVSVVTQQRMREQGVTSIKEALLISPGITVVAAEPGADFYSRGFRIRSFEYDGVPLERQLYTRGSGFTGDSVIYDRVEVLRGPQGLLEGSGDPSGAVNLVRKRPTYERQFVLTGKTGSWDTYGTQVDLGGPLNDTETVRGRFIANYETADSFVDYINSMNRTVYGALDFDLSPDTTIGIGFSREKPTNTPNYAGLANYADGSMPNYSRSTNLTAPWAYGYKTQDTYYADLSHRLNENWKVKATVVGVEESNDFKYELRQGRLGPPNTFRGDVYVFDFNSKQIGADVHITGNTQFLGRKLDLTAGANFSYMSSDDIWGGKYNIESLNSSYDQRSNVAEPSDAEIYAANKWVDGYKSRKKGLYATGSYELTDALSIVLGARLSSYENIYSSNGPWGASTTLAKESKKVTPFTGLIYKLGDQWSAYASYADIFKPQSRRNASGDFLEPVIGKGYELGLKGSLLDGRVNTSAALFQTEQRNIGFQDDGVPIEIANAQCGGTCYRSSALFRNRGLEAEVSGEVAKGLQLYAAYTLTTSKYIGTDVPAIGANDFAGTGMPKHVLRIWANYHLPGAWNKISVGGGLASQSHFSDFAYYGREQGGYTLYNARLGYEFNKNLSAGLNINNIFDKRYFQSISYDHNFYGAPRSFYLTVQYRM